MAKEKNKKSGCLIAVIVIVAIGIVAAAAGGKKKSEDSASDSVKITSSSTVSSEKKSQDKNEKNDSLAYEMTDTNFSYYTTSIGTVEYYGFVEITNTGSCNIYLDNCTFDIEDNDGHLLESDKLIYSSPDIIAPGEKGYFYNGLGSNVIDSNVSVDNGLVLVPNYKIEKANGDIIEYDVSDTDMHIDDLGYVKVTGRITNNTDDDEKYLGINVIFYDDSGNVLFITNSSVTDLNAGSTVSFEASTLFSDNSVNKDDIASFQVIARKSYHQF